MSKRLIEIASEIVQTQVSLTPMSSGEIASSLKQVFITLQDLQKAETEGTEPVLSTEGTEGAEETGAPKLSPENSILNDKIICLECGAEFKQLTEKHLTVHSMNPKEYRKKYGFTSRTPLAAKSLTRARSKAAKKRGIPENLKKFLEARRAGKVEAAASEASASADDGKQQGQTKLRKKAK